MLITQQPYNSIWLRLISFVYMVEQGALLSEASLLKIRTNHVFLFFVLSL